MSKEREFLKDLHKRLSEFLDQGVIPETPETFMLETAEPLREFDNEELGEESMELFDELLRSVSEAPLLDHGLVSAVKEKPDHAMEPYARFHSKSWLEFERAILIARRDRAESRLVDSVSVASAEKMSRIIRAAQSPQLHEARESVWACVLGETVIEPWESMARFGVSIQHTGWSALASKVVEVYGASNKGCGYQEAQSSAAWEARATLRMMLQEPYLDEYARGRRFTIHPVMAALPRPTATTMPEFCRTSGLRFFFVASAPNESQQQRPMFYVVPPDSVGQEYPNGCASKKQRADRLSARTQEFNYNARDYAIPIYGVGGMLVVVAEGSQFCVGPENTCIVQEFSVQDFEAMAPQQRVISALGYIASCITSGAQHFDGAAMTPPSRERVVTWHPHPRQVVWTIDDKPSRFSAVDLAVDVMRSAQPNKTAKRSISMVKSRKALQARDITACIDPPRGHHQRFILFVQWLLACGMDVSKTRFAFPFYDTQSQDDTIFVLGEPHHEEPCQEEMEAAYGEKRKDRSEDNFKVAKKLRKTIYTF